MNKLHQFRPIKMVAMLAIAASSALVLTGCPTSTGGTGGTSTPTTSPTTSPATTTAPSPGASTPATTGGDKTEAQKIPNIASMTCDGKGADPISFLLSDTVKKEVKFDDKQTADLKAVCEETRTNINQKYISLGLDKLDKKGKEEKLKSSDKEIQAFFQETRGKVEKIIKADQQKRLKEVTLQHFGWGPLTSEIFSADLKLTDKQKTDLKTIEQQMQTKNQTGWQIPEGDEATKTKTLETNRKRMEAILKEVNEQSLAVLTAEQKTALEKLKGAPIAN